MEKLIKTLDGIILKWARPMAYALFITLSVKLIGSTIKSLKNIFNKPKTKSQETK